MHLAPLPAAAAAAAAAESILRFLTGRENVCTASPPTCAQQPLPHVIVLAAPPPELRAKAVHALQLLAGEDYNPAKEVLRQR